MARRIAANVAKLLLRKPTATVRGKLLAGWSARLRLLMRHHVINAPVKSPVQKPDQVELRGQQTVDHAALTLYVALPTVGTAHPDQ